MNVNEAIKTYIRSGSGADRWGSAVVTVGGVSYVKFDAVRIGNATDSAAGVSVQFLHQGVAIAWQRIPKARLAGFTHFASETGPDGVQGLIKI